MTWIINYNHKRYEIPDNQDSFNIFQVSAPKEFNPTDSCVITTITIYKDGRVTSEDTPNTPNINVNPTLPNKNNVLGMSKKMNPFGIQINDYVVYTYPRPMTVYTNRNYALAAGTILSVLEFFNNLRECNCKIISGGQKEIQGTHIIICCDRLKPLNFPYIKGDNNIEIIAPIQFKKINLQGQKGVVISPTDSDGDVGIEFVEDINAGSLDGTGKNGHCLYIPASVVKKIQRR